MTDPTLREYLEAKIAALDRHVTAEIEALKATAMEAKVTQEKKNEAANEWRGAMTDAANRFATNEKAAGLEQRIYALEAVNVAAMGKQRGVASVGTIIAWVLGAIGSLFGIAGGVAWAFTVLGKQP